MERVQSHTHKHHLCNHTYTSKCTYFIELRGRIFVRMKFHSTSNKCRNEYVPNQINIGQVGKKSK